MRARKVRIGVAATVIAVALCGATTLAVPGRVAAGSTSCTYDGANHAVTIRLTGDFGVVLMRSKIGHILVSGIWCAGQATITNTDSIAINGDSGSQAVKVSLANRGFRPGWTDEPGSSDEIEFSVVLRGGFDEFNIEGTGGSQAIDYGRFVAPWGTFGLINLNVATDPALSQDFDVTMSGVEEAGFVGKGGSDHVTADTYYMDTYSGRLVLYGGAGNDSLKGGTANDKIYGGAGSDSAWGGAGNDTIDLRDGEPGNDYGEGEAGTDVCLADPGDTLFSNCETKIQT